MIAPRDDFPSEFERQVNLAFGPGGLLAQSTQFVGQSVLSFERSGEEWYPPSGMIEPTYLLRKPHSQQQ